ncbi:hypothetical protein ACFWOJ_23560 [Streptomyces sp. NPDC058439]|uniref:hypothetical protein n=1 Tax=Streptomyces sp. NPDC058439 TaxID=3346500 RepID=UPI00365B9B62
MRKNGQPEFPDPDKNGFFAPEENGIDVKSPEFKAVHKACQKFLPAGAAARLRAVPAARSMEAPAPR